MRLIDANVIDFTCTYNGDCMADKEKCKKCEYYVCSFSDIQNLPTAYDVDGVVERLKDERFAIEQFEYDSFDVIEFEDAIQIVKKGGVE